MGHFSQTCLLSHLPVVGGTPIRVCLLSSSPYDHSDRHGEAWSFRSIPFRAKYNDYGSIKDIVPEDEVLVDLAIAQFNRDAVEIPQGMNPYHDPPVTRGMPAEDWWNALWEGRLQVQESWGQTLKVKVPKGVPTWRRVAKLLARINEQLLVGHFDLWHSDGSLLFRNSLLLAGSAEANDAQCEALIRFAVDTCERYFPAVQFVVWAGQPAGEALEAAMIDTWGEA